MPHSRVCWRAVTRRDPTYDGVFVYAVLSTRVYCRPSCPSRRPAQKRVVFFKQPEEAEHSGFRPCLRCHPRLNPGLNSETKRVLDACRYIENNLENPLSLATLAKQFGISRFHLQRTFKKATGISPREYASAFRMKFVKGQLRSGRPVTAALYAAGYGSSSRLYERAAAQLGMTPATYRKGGSGMQINYVTTRCPLGWILVGATERGVCAVRMGDRTRDLEQGLRSEFPRAALNGSHPRLSQWIEKIVSHLRGESAAVDIPVDVQATAFQRRVWQELSKIPYGETKSYQEVARRIGKPKAVRAVGRACAINPVAVVVPCHRVLRSDGNLGGYRWGLDRKQALLRLERVHR